MNDQLRVKVINNVCDILQERLPSGFDSFVENKDLIRVVPNLSLLKVPGQKKAKNTFVCVWFHSLNQGYVEVYANRLNDSRVKCELADAVFFDTVADRVNEFLKEQIKKQLEISLRLSHSSLERLNQAVRHNKLYISCLKGFYGETISEIVPAEYDRHVDVLSKLDLLLNASADFPTLDCHDQD